MAKKKSKHKRVDFSTYEPLYDREFNTAYMEQLQDSLIARGYPDAQRLAFLATALHESGGNPKAVAKGKDKKGNAVTFSGLYQWGDSRFPNTWDLGEQIHYALESAESHDTKKSWTDGGTGVPYIRRASEGRDAFWNSEDPYEATLYFNKGYVRPAEEQARINRAKEAANMANSFKLGGLPDKIDVTVGGKSLAEGPLTNQELGITSKVPTSVLDKIGAGISGVAGIVGAGMSNAKIKDTSEYQTAIDRAYNTTYSGDANSILAQYEANKPIQAPEVEDLKLGLGTKISNTLGAVTSGAMAGSTIGGPWGAVIGGATGLLSGVTGAIVGDMKAKREAERLNTEALAANQASINNLNVGLNNAGEQELLYNLARTAKYGGKINIKPSKRGTFTRAAKSRGLEVQEFASKVLSNPDNYSEAMRKKAQFARNFGSRKHSMGGYLVGQTYDISEQEYNRLIQLGYEIEVL